MSAEKVQNMLGLLVDSYLVVVFAWRVSVKRVAFVVGWVLLDSHHKVTTVQTV